MHAARLFHQAIIAREANDALIFTCLSVPGQCSRRRHFTILILLANIAIFAGLFLSGRRIASLPIVIEMPCQHRLYAMMTFHFTTHGVVLKNRRQAGLISILLFLRWLTLENASVVA